MIQEGDRTYFYVEAQVIVNDRDKHDRFEQTIFTRKVDSIEQHEAIWLHVYRALRPGVDDKLIITHMEEVDAPETAD